MKTVNLGWCLVELREDGRLIVYGDRFCGAPIFTPDEARQLAEALCEVADPHGDPLEAKARELFEVLYGGPFPPWGSASYDKFIRLARHVLAGNADRDTGGAK